LTVPEYQERERRLARAYRALAQCNRALVRATGEPDLLHQLCKLLVQVGEYELAWVGFAMEDAERTVRCVARAGHSDGYLESIRVTWADEPHGRGPTGACIRRQEPVVYRDTQTQPGFEPWRAQAAERGLASVIGLPIVVAGRCIGALTVYASNVDAFDSDEKELLLRLAEDLAFGIGALRDRSAFEDASAGKALASVDGRYVRVNRALCRMLGYAADELVGMRVADVTHPEDRAPTSEGIRSLLAGEAATVRLAKRYVRKDGGTVFAEVGVSLARGGDASPRYLIADVQDVTARHLAEAELRRP
jgi:PAS domain S-box-containing protein